LRPKFLELTKSSRAMGAPVVMKSAPDNPTLYVRLAEKKIIEHPVTKRTLC
jgi:hypothetical protein